MNIAENIARITQGKANIKSTASKKNIQIPDSDRIEDYASAFDQYWPNCSFGLRYDDPYLIQGTTKKWNQLINLDNVISETVNGVEKQVLYKNKIRLTGTVNVSSSWIATYEISTIQGHKYALLNFNDHSDVVNKYYYSSSLDVFRSPNILTATVSRENDTIYFIGLGGAVFNETLQGFAVDLTEVYGAGNEPTDINSLDIKEMTMYALNNPEKDSGSLRYGYYKGIKLGQYDFIDTLDNVLHIGGAEVDMGELNWSYTSGTYSRFEANVNGIKPTEQKENIVCVKYLTDTITHVYLHSEDNIIAVHNSLQRIWVYDSSYTNANYFKSSLNGVKLYYKLETPIEIDL